MAFDLYKNTTEYFVDTGKTVFVKEKGVWYFPMRTLESHGLITSTECDNDTYAIKPVGYEKLDGYHIFCTKQCEKNRDPEMLNGV